MASVNPGNIFIQDGILAPPWLRDAAHACPDGWRSVKGSRFALDRRLRESGWRFFS